MSYSKEVRDFSIRLMNGEPMESPEDLQFYLNYREEIEEFLKNFKDDDETFSNKTI